MKEKNYYVSGFGGWFVISCRNIRKAKSAGVAEFGSGNVTKVRMATKKEVSEYIVWRGRVDSGEC
jgi:hypothetical protein